MDPNGNGNEGNGGNGGGEQAAGGMDMGSWLDAVCPDSTAAERATVRRLAQAERWDQGSMATKVREAFHLLRPQGTAAQSQRSSDGKFAASTPAAAAPPRPQLDPVASKPIRVPDDGSALGGDPRSWPADVVRRMDVTSFRKAIVEFERSQGRGSPVAHLRKR